MPRNRSADGVGGGLGRFRSFVWGLAGLLILPLLTTCGLETITIFTTPAFSVTGPNQLTLVHNTANNDSSFSGYEIYYRAFDSNTDADSARGRIESAAALVTATPEYCNALLASQGFTRMFDANGNDGINGARPLFVITAADKAASTAVTFDLILDVQSSSTVTANWHFSRRDSPGTQIEVTRSVSHLNQPISFESSYSPSDVDYSGVGAVTGQTRAIYFIFFAVAYGVDASSTAFASSFSLPASVYQPALVYYIP